ERSAPSPSLLRGAAVVVIAEDERGDREDDSPEPSLCAVRAREETGVEDCEEHLLRHVLHLGGVDASAPSEAQDDAPVPLDEHGLRAGLPRGGVADHVPDRRREAAHARYLGLASARRTFSASSVRPSASRARASTSPPQ